MLPIAIVGGSSSGKSQYLAALIKTLKEGGLSGLGCSSFRAASQDVDVRYKADYYAPLFVSREPLIHTQRIRTSEVYVPLVYEAEFAGGTSSRSAEPRKVNLVFFDVSGEDLQDQDTLRRGVAHIVNAAAILLLIDPLTLPNVVEVLPKYFRADDAITAASDDAYQMMSKLTAVFALNRDGRRSHRIPVPLALTIAKSDLLEFVIGGLPPDSPLLQDTRYPRG